MALEHNARRQRMQTVPHTSHTARFPAASHDSMFDDYLDDVLRPHAPLLSGVTILQPLTDNDLF